LKDTQSIFEKRKVHFLKFENDLKKKSKRLSLIRISAFIGFVILVVQLANLGEASAVWIVTTSFVLLFIILLKWHNKIRKAALVQQALKEINENELKRIHLEINEFDDGMRFYDLQHPYHEDLDIFGKHSLYQLINRSATEEGSQKLADWLSNSADKATIEARQSSINELKDKLEFRQNFEASGRIKEQMKGSKEAFLAWLSSERKMKGKLIYQVILAIFPALMFALIIGASLGYLETGWPILIAFVNMAILGTVFNPLSEIGKQTENGYKSIGILEELIHLVEKEDFKDPLLHGLQEKMSAGGQSAAQTLGQLKFILDNIHNRANLMYVIFDILFLLDVYWLLRIDNWKQKNKLELQHWFDTLAEFDALNCLAGFAFSNQDFVMPSISEKPYQIDANEMGHPLIPKEKRVNNSFAFTGKGGICLITGSNMSGKSTFLRTLGVNMVLAQSGAPVCASTMSLSLSRVFTSMRTKDELEENVSSFYAELKRLKKLIESIDPDQPTLFMIDEVLKGTNSEDRHKGAISLIKQLNKADAFGLVSTHDLVLGSLANQLDGVKNYSFNSIIEGDEIIFDYTLTEGICKSFNATKLMQNMGIDIPED
jgi:DNA mismatch repair ATPase MutS